MSMIGEFKAFIARGNVLDLAVAVIIAAAFGKIITALVDGMIMPVVGMAMGGVDFSQLFHALDGNDYANLAAAQAAAAPVITYGAFVQTIIDFLLIALVIFLIVRAYNRMRPPVEAAPVVAEDTLLLREIRDSLAAREPR